MKEDSKPFWELNLNPITMYKMYDRNKNTIFISEVETNLNSLFSGNKLTIDLD